MVSTEETQTSSAAVQWSVAAMTIGSVLVLLAPLILILSAQIWAHSFKSAGVVLFHAWLARISVGIVALLAITGLGCALRSIRLGDYLSCPRDAPWPALSCPCRPAHCG